MQIVNVDVDDLKVLLGRLKVRRLQPHWGGMPTPLASGVWQKRQASTLPCSSDFCVCIDWGRQEARYGLGGAVPPSPKTPARS